MMKNLFKDFRMCLAELNRYARKVKNIGKTKKSADAGADCLNMYKTRKGLK